MNEINIKNKEKIKKISLSLNVENNSIQSEYLLEAAKNGYVFEVANADYRVDSFYIEGDTCYLNLKEV